MGVPVIEGRDFDASDVPTGPPVIVLNRSAARRYFGSAAPIGRNLDWHFEDGRAQMRVIGVVEDLRQDSPLDEVFPEVFVEYRQFLLLLARWKQSPLYQSEWALGVFSIAVKTRSDPAIAIPLIRKTVSTVDPNVAVDSVASMDRLLGSTLARQRFYATCLTAFASLSGILAIIGVYGVLAYTVSFRVREFGIRIALGAPHARVWGRVLGQGLLLTTVGITLGLIAAATVTGILRGILFGITPLDPATFVAVAVLFGLVSAAASSLPARQAVKVDPIVILKSE
jgi:putative ABC transport system permease protein